jgi:hypothetical protein
MFKDLLLAVFAVLLTFLAAELALNFMVESSELSSGMFLGRELPPLDILPADPVPDSDYRQFNAQTQYKSLEQDGRKITKGDLWGLLEEDPVTGYRPVANSVSVNGWWQSNNIAARSRVDTTPTPSAGITRSLFFGESYTKGVLPQEEAFVTRLNDQLPDHEVLNLGVDGYGMGQAYLYYQSIKERVGYDRVFLVLVPRIDMWRDINLNRYIIRRFHSYKMYPRFELENGQLNLVANPFSTLQEQIEQDPDHTLMRERMRQHDSFYVPALFDSMPLVDWSVSARLVRLWFGEKQRQNVIDGLEVPGLEATKVTRSIVAAMAAEVRQEGGEFTLIILPSLDEVVEYRDIAGVTNKWQQLADYLCAPGVTCVDLMPDLAELPPEQLDYGYDGGHYGKHANAAIANMLQEKLFN